MQHLWMQFTSVFITNAVKLTQDFDQISAFRGLGRARQSPKQIAQFLIQGIHECLKQSQFTGFDKVPDEFGHTGRRAGSPHPFPNHEEFGVLLIAGLEVVQEFDCF